MTISAAIHVAAVAWVGARELGHRDDAPRVTMTEIEIVAPQAPPPEPILPVQFLDEQQTAALDPKSTPRPKRIETSRATAGATLGATGSEPAATTGRDGPNPTEPGGTRSKYFDMRRGDRPDLTLGKGRFDDLENAPRGTAPAKGIRSSGQLESAAGGRKKSDQDVFVAKVDRDGTVKMVDSRNLTAELSWNPAKLLSGRFDVTDWIMRSTKNDPYSSRKLKFLDETRDERVEMGKQWKQQQLQQTAMIMRKNLQRAWAASEDFAAKKRALFELWDEIIEADGSDEILAEASRAARNAVIGFIRARLPQGSEHAFSDGELIAFNRTKQSTATFAPYE